MNFILFSVICLIIANESVFAEEVIECNDESNQKLDTFMMELSKVGDPNGKYPTNQEEMEKMCKTDREKHKWCIAYIDKCMKGTAQQMMSLSVKDSQKMLNKYCDSVRLSKIYISWAKCGDNALNQTFNCWQKYIIQMERINMTRETIPDDDKMPLICCTFHTYDHCIEEALVSKGEDICPPKVVSGIHSLLDDITGDTLQIHCGDYATDNDKCDGLKKKYNHLNDIKIEKIRKSPTTPFTEILTGMTFRTPEYK